MITMIGIHHQQYGLGLPKSMFTTKIPLNDVFLLIQCDKQSKLRVANLQTNPCGTRYDLRTTMYHFWIVPINSCMYACMHECMDARNARNALNAHNAPDAHNARSIVQRNMTTWQMMSNSVRQRDLIPKHGGVKQSSHQYNISWACLKTGNPFHPRLNHHSAFKN